jgi:phage anti-repressor protein
MADTTALVPVFSGTIADHSVQLCCARTLHTFMQVRRDFTTWVKGRIRKFCFVAGEDFITISRSPELGSGNRGAATDYHLTLDMAKELSMVENNAQGRAARRYFIECERQAMAASQPTPYTVQPSDTLNEPQQIALRAMLESNVKRLPHAKQAGAMIKGWSKLKAHFGVPYRQIPAGEFEEAISIIARHVSEWELVDEAPQQPQQDQEIDVAALLLSGQCDPKPLTAAQHMLIDQCAGRLVGEAYPLIRAHLERRVAWNSNAAQQNSAEATQAILGGATLGNCLAHHYRTELQAAHTVMQVVRQRLDAALGSIIQPLGLSH